ncbi:M14 family metallopeptidase [Egbenema bharatensis]|uniref:M14 family metallopeptidase n=1 Tax=Egbenema bharatensis TaxID=3463334 RepID=UPI003A8B7E48
MAPAPIGYLSVKGISDALQYLRSTYPAICYSTAALNASIEGRAINAIRIAGGQRSDRRGILLIAGVHARELINPDLLIRFALRLCYAYTHNKDLIFKLPEGSGKTYSASLVKALVENLDLFILPLVNPDGRAWVQDPAGDFMWRKNRRVNPGSSCKGVDINRNFDFLWSSGIGTSSNPCSDIYKGSAPFSEPETQNVRRLLDTYPNIGYFVDIHSASELILYPWGDDDNQTTDPNMNFRNPAYNGKRGNPGVDPPNKQYREYIPKADLDWFIATGNRMRDAIATVRGRTYTVQQSVGLYPTTATTDDYAYSRHFVDATKRKVRGVTLETERMTSSLSEWGYGFQPPYAEALKVMEEVSAALMEYCIASLCATETITSGIARGAELAQMRAFRDQQLAQSPLGQQWLGLFNNYAGELNTLMVQNDALRVQMAQMLLRLNQVTRMDQEPTLRVFEPELIHDLNQLLQTIATQGSPEMQQQIEALRQAILPLQGQPVPQGLELSAQPAVLS